MRKYKLLLLGCCLLACSPYKKVTLTMSEQLTTRWKGAGPDAVVAAIGTFKSKTPHDEGYILRFDFSYAKPTTFSPSSNSAYKIEVGSSTPYNSRMATGLVPRTNPSPDVKRFLASDSVIKFMEFYFDKTGTVNSVYAQGYPDSIYYVKRRG
jgi:hypothetical protein